MKKKPNQKLKIEYKNKEQWNKLVDQVIDGYVALEKQIEDALSDKYDKIFQQEWYKKYEW